MIQMSYENHMIIIQNVTIVCSLKCLSQLEKELVTLGAVCSGVVLTEDFNLPYPGQ